MEPLAYLYLVQDQEDFEDNQWTAPMSLSLSTSLAVRHRSGKVAGLIGVLSSVLVLAPSNSALATGGSTSTGFTSGEFTSGHELIGGEFTKVILTDEYAKSYAGGGYFYILQDFIRDRLALAVPNPPHPPVPTPPIASPPVAPPSHCTTLKYGDSGPAVQCLQDLLRQAGYFDGTSTGYFGPATKEAVKAFQYHCGLFVDGIAGPQTIAALHSVLGHSATPIPY
ncbi:peptidoglycan-binding domain-containing protein [Thermocoleostomius sinensis]|uniref:Peptidoglycan-binding domain-containing protein n=1 Tax=Thermocoleostomius sinensis A174 TaxID=2016057 RepID=A0A9E9C7T6_9CYAN|nr:peptidoglycan-binding domain-containing protein [Thermocoleostomius sinensis]WAL60694.1 peptidoglycan-binding domain-containing protein [Thermocoleostomius sinensis A174]